MEDARYFENGRLVIFRRSDVFYARVRTIDSDKYIWRSLRTSDQQAAIQAGRKLLFNLEQRSDQGLPVKSKLFSTVVDDYVAYRERDHVHGKTTLAMKKSKKPAKRWIRSSL